ncbi:hypothetical protein [Clostridium saccharoperbutylacetonicum]|uniref:hypothetical protein n=1 Tax=Clostridium saccharoperbutylacetonicum TaxID=36745 RepID=UPI0039EBF5DB
MKKAFELKDGTIIYSNDVKCLIVNGIEEEYSHKKVLDAAKKIETIGAILVDGTKLNPSDISNYHIFG